VRYAIWIAHKFQKTGEKAMKVLRARVYDHIHTAAQDSMIQSVNLQGCTGVRRNAMIEPIISLK